MLTYRGKEIQDDYNVEKDSTLHALLKLRAGGCPSEKYSEIIGYIEEDIQTPLKPLDIGIIAKRYSRNTNSTGAYQQKKGTCYAYAACSAYINTIMRIYGSRPPPTFRECYQIACYSENGGKASEAIKRLEDHFHYGICYRETNKTTILKIMTISVILYFTTSKNGWDKISDGQLLETPCGTNDGWHAVLIEGYDLDKDCLICKNSWAKSGKDRFDLKIQALKDYGFIEVYFTLKSIREIGIGEFTPKIKKFRIIKNWQIINCAWMDKITAIYSTEYICEYHKEQKGELKYKGVYIKDWINLNLNRD